MGGSNTKGLYLCEKIYPPEDGRSCIPPEKLQKAIEKGIIPPPPNADEEDVDDDEDAKIDQYIKEVWGYYDKKAEGFVGKKQAQQFFKDALEIFAVRKNCKVKDLLRGNSLDKALEQSFRRLDKNNLGRIDFATFEEFINECDLDEALNLITGETGPIVIRTDNVELVDTTAIAAQAQAQASGAGAQQLLHGRKVPVLLRHHACVQPCELRRCVPLMQHGSGAALGRQGASDGGLLLP